MTVRIFNVTLRFHSEIWIAECKLLSFIRTAPTSNDAIRQFTERAKTFFEDDGISDWTLTFKNISLRPEDQVPIGVGKGFKIGVCELCEITCKTNRHHLVPKSVGGHGMTCRLCLGCHKFIHKTFSNKQLGIAMNSIEALKRQDRVISYIGRRKSFVKK